MMTVEEMKNGSPTDPDDAPEENDDGAPFLAAPRPIGRGIILAFFSILLLIIVTQGLATWNAGTLSETIATYTARESVIRELTLALFEIEDANTMLRDWLLTFDADRFDPSAFSLHVANATETLGRIESLPEHRPKVRDAIAAALEDLKTRTVLTYSAIQEENHQAATEIAMDRRAIANAFSLLGNDIRGDRAESERVQAAAARQARTLDLSLALITIAMIVMAMLLAFLWKRLVSQRLVSLH